MRTTKTQFIMLSRMFRGPYGIRTRLNLLSDSQASTPKKQTQRP